jgi:hypothetical protein
MGYFVGDVDNYVVVAHAQGFNDLFLFPVYQEPERVLAVADGPTIGGGVGVISTRGAAEGAASGPAFAARVKVLAAAGGVLAAFSAASASRRSWVSS